MVIASPTHVQNGYLSHCANSSADKNDRCRRDVIDPNIWRLTVAADPTFPF
jgi:hypothetical protein